MASVATTDTTRTAATNNNNGIPSSPRAPRVQFGDDDSPRIETGTDTDVEPKGSCSPREKWSILHNTATLLIALMNFSHFISLYYYFEKKIEMEYG